MKQSDDENAAGARDTLLYRALEGILLPVARWVVHFRIPYRTFAHLVRRVLVRAATERAEPHPSGKPHISKIALATGLARRDVKTVCGELEDDLATWARDHRGPRLTTLVATWRDHRPWCIARGEPRDLTRAEFDKLVADTAHPDYPSSVVLDDLLQNNTVAYIHGKKETKLRLVEKTFLSKALTKNTVDYLEAASRRFHGTVLHNLKVMEEFGNADDAELKARKLVERQLYTRELPDDMARELTEELKEAMEADENRYIKIIEAKEAAAEKRYGKTTKNNPTVVGLGWFQFEEPNDQYKGSGGEK